MEFIVGRIIDGIRLRRLWSRILTDLYFAWKDFKKKLDKKLQERGICNKCKGVWYTYTKENSFPMRSCNPYCNHEFKRWPLDPLEWYDYRRKNKKFLDVSYKEYMEEINKSMATSNE